VSEPAAEPGSRGLKVVLFCGGRGIRLREASETLPKPMVPIGYRPILWHVMRYYAHFGQRDFVLCLGYKADVIKDYFLRYNEALSNDFVLDGKGHGGDGRAGAVTLLQSDIDDWRISFIDTGLNANIGERLRAVRSYVAGDEIFLANYGDVVTDAPLDTFIADFRKRDKIAAFISVRPTSYSFHVVRFGKDGLVAGLDDVRSSDLWINGGFFIFRREIFDYLRPGEELVEAPFARLIADNQLISYRYDGFWAPMDTLKDVQMLEAHYESGRAPWALWQRDRAPEG
jgi:glucose-1-phosphate cytidylyltransferase